MRRSRNDNNNNNSASGLVRATQQYAPCGLLKYDSYVTFALHPIASDEVRILKIRNDDWPKWVPRITEQLLAVRQNLTSSARCHCLVDRTRSYRIQSQRRNFKF